MCLAMMLLFLRLTILIKLLKMFQVFLGIPKAFVKHPHHPHEKIIGNIYDGVKTRSRIEKFAH